jgi:hypothetical protein
MDKYRFHEDTTDGIVHVVASKVVSYPMTTVAVWVYYAKLSPLDKKNK